MHAKPNRDTVPQVINGRINGRFAKGFSGNPGGSPEATRRAFNKRFLLDLAEDWQQHGREVFKRVRRESPASYLKVCAMLVPREMQIEHTNLIKQMTDEEIEQAIERYRRCSRLKPVRRQKSSKGRRSLPRCQLPRHSPPGLGLSQSASAGRTDW